MRWWWSPAREVLIAADPDVALLSTAAALRRLGARITRYDSEAGTLEARVAPAARVRVRTIPVADGATTVRLEGDGAARRVLRRFRAALGA
jgi:hypothetical protein